MYPRYMGGGGGSSMLCESQAVWDQWTFSVSQVHGEGAPCYVNHRLFGTSGHSVYPRYMGRGLHVMGITDCLGLVDIQCIPGTWGGGSMLCESQAVCDQWTFSVSQVHGGGGGAPCYVNHRLFGTSGHSVYPRYMGRGLHVM